MAKKKAAVKKGKKAHKSNPTSKRYKKYKIEGDKIERNARFCPRCGPGIFLMNSQNRLYCGKCHYSEFKTGDKEKSGEGKESKKSEEKK